MASDDSILKTIKKLLNLTEENTDFDFEIIVHINSVFVTLNQLGVGPAGGFFIDDSTPQWSDYITDGDDLRVNQVKTYMALRIRMIYDPPDQSWHVTAMEKQIEELAWRLNVDQETTDYYHDDPEVDISLPVDRRVVPVESV